eukprot:8971563-Karenia_brevis.AAC.1
MRSYADGFITAKQVKEDHSLHKLRNKASHSYDLDPPAFSAGGCSSRNWANITELDDGIDCTSENGSGDVLIDSGEEFLPSGSSSSLPLVE